jgi:hypothetical protein
MLEIDLGAVAHRAGWGYGVDPPSDTQTGEFSPKTDIRLNTQVAGRPVPAAPTQPVWPVSPPAELVAAAPIAPVIPSATRRRGTHGRAGVVSALPLASGPPSCPEAPRDVVYGIGRIDASGRVADRAVSSALGWHNGDRLTVTADAGVVIARRDPGGMVTVPTRPCIVIPAALRRRCGLRAGDLVLLAAVPGKDTLAAYSFTVVDQAIRTHGPFPGGDGGRT